MSLKKEIEYMYIRNVHHKTTLMKLDLRLLDLHPNIDDVTTNFSLFVYI